MRAHLPKFTGPVLVAVTVGSVLSVNAGSLTPPGGPIAPTMKPLTDVEPRTAMSAANTPGDADSIYKISQSGSYYLTGNITGVAGKMGIEIAASGVTIDLMGFDVAGIAGSLNGIRATVANTTNVAVRNGSVRNWAGMGIDVSLCDHVQLNELRILSNGAAGIQGNNAVSVTNCTISSNTGTGMLLLNAAVVIGCTMQGNAGSGMSANLTAVVAHCAARLNGGSGINVSSGSNVTDCTATENSSKGILVGNGATIANCTALANHDDGLRAAQSCTVTNCASQSNSGGDGIEIGANTTVTGCTANNNAGNGIAISSAFDTATVIECKIISNALNGISIGGGAISGCDVTANGLDGIRVIGSSRITDNKCTSNGPGANIGAGIHVTQTDCDIEGNFVAFNDTGIDVDSGANYIMGNRARANGTNYDIVAGNVVGTTLFGSSAVNAATNNYGNLSF